MSSAISSKEKLVCAQFAQFQKIKRWRNILHSQESITYGNYFLYVQPACFCSCNGREWPWIHYTMGFNLWFEHWQILSITWYLQIKKNSFISKWTSVETFDVLEFVDGMMNTPRNISQETFCQSLICLLIESIELKIGIAKLCFRFL